MACMANDTKVMLENVITISGDDTPESKTNLIDTIMKAGGGYNSLVRMKEVINRWGPDHTFCVR